VLKLKAFPSTIVFRSR